MPWRTARPLRGQTRPGVARRDLEVQRRRHRGATAGRDHDGLARAEVGAGGGGRAVLGQGAPGADADGEDRAESRWLRPSGLPRRGPRSYTERRGARGMIAQMSRANLFGMSKDALVQLATERGEPAFRGRQLYGWLYHHRVRDFAAMDNLPKALREALAGEFDVRWPEVAERALSTDGTRKYLFRLARRGHDRGRLHPRGRPPDDLHLDAGRLSAEVRVLPDRDRRLPAQPQARRDPGPGGDRDGRAPRGRDAPAPPRRGPLPVEHRGHGHGRAAAQLRRDRRGAARADGRGRLRRRTAQADALDGRHPAGAREAGAGAGAPQPRDQPARARPGAAARADADRGEVRDGRRDRGRAPLSGPARGAGHVRVRAARRRQRHARARARARAPALGQARARST